MNESFPKEEKLCRKKLIQEVFTTGSPIQVPPYKVRWLYASFIQGTPAQILIAVPKASFRHAADRNTIRRRIREAYRKNRYILHESLNSAEKQMAVAITYTGRKILPYSTMEEKIILLLQRLKNENEKASE